MRTIPFHIKQKLTFVISSTYSVFLLKRLKLYVKLNNSELREASKWLISALNILRTS